MNEFWQPWVNGPTGTNITFLGPTGAVTGPAYYGVTGTTGPTAGTEVTQHKHMNYLYTQARARLSGASDAMVRAVMVEVFHEFFNDSTIWKEEIPGVLQPGVKLYYLQPGNPESQLDPFPKGEIIGIVGLMDVNHFPLGADMPEPPVMRLQYAQSNPLSAWVTVIKNICLPHDGNLPEVPYWVVQTFETGLLNGIVGKMQLQDGKPYSNLPLGRMNYGSFRNAVTMARTRALRRNTFGTNAWTYPQQFRAGSQRGGISVGNARIF